MDLIKKFFTESPTIIDLLYLILGVSFGGSMLFHFLPEEKVLQWFVTYRGYERKKEEYDWATTLKRQKVYLFSVFIYSTVILFLSFLLGERVAKIGTPVLAVLVFFASFWLSPVKNDASCVSEEVPMSKKKKSYLSILIMSVTFFMMIDTRYARPLGDYVFELFGLNSWTGDQTGLHLSVIFFGVLFVVSIQFVQKYAMGELNMSWKRIVIYLIGLTIFFSFSTGIIAKSIKADAEGLLAIGIEKRSNLSYEFDGERYTQYDVNITLKNYSDEEQYFYLTLDDRSGMGSAQLYNLDGDQNFFHLKGKEQKTFSITAENVHLKDINLPDYDWASGSGRIDRLILTNKSGEKVRMADSNFIGETLTD